MDIDTSYVEWQRILLAKEKENGTIERKHDTKVLSCTNATCDVLDT
jgi:hypothetical protein